MSHMSPGKAHPVGSHLIDSLTVPTPLAAITTILSRLLPLLPPLWLLLSVLWGGALSQLQELRVSLRPHLGLGVGNAVMPCSSREVPMRQCVAAVGEGGASTQCMW